jgi:hypothetical protein
VTVRVARPRDSELEHVLDEVRARPEVRLVELEHGD